MTPITSPGCALYYTTPCYSLAASASAYATFFGILATVVFVLLGLIFSVEGADLRGFRSAVQPLLGAFFGLVLTTFMYATLSGDQAINRAVLEDVIAAATAAGSVVQLFVALAHCFLGLSESTTAPLKLELPEADGTTKSDGSRSEDRAAILFSSKDVLLRVMLAIAALAISLAAAFVVATYDAGFQAVTGRAGYSYQNQWKCLWAAELLFPAAAMMVANRRRRRPLVADLRNEHKGLSAVSVNLAFLVIFSFVGGIIFSIVTSGPATSPKSTIISSCIVAFGLGLLFAAQIWSLLSIVARVKGVAVVGMGIFDLLRQQSVHP
jgi:hypothetical protein